MTKTQLRAALYARVSSDHQAKAATIESQLSAIESRIAEDQHILEDELRFVDDGYTGSTLLRPGLERLRDMAYAGAMGGLDAIVFTGGIGENSPQVRKGAASGLEFAGILLDRKKNEETRGRGAIHKADSKTQILVIPTNEELVIARDAKDVYAKHLKKRAA